LATRSATGSGLKPDAPARGGFAALAAACAVGASNYASSGVRNEATANSGFPNCCWLSVISHELNSSRAWGAVLGFAGRRYDVVPAARSGAAGTADALLALLVRARQLARAPHAALDAQNVTNELAGLLHNVSPFSGVPAGSEPRNLQYGLDEIYDAIHFVFMEMPLGPLRAVYVSGLTVTIRATRRSGAHGTAHAWASAAAASYNSNATEADGLKLIVGGLTRQAWLNFVGVSQSVVPERAATVNLRAIVASAHAAGVQRVARAHATALRLFPGVAAAALSALALDAALGDAGAAAAAPSAEAFREIAARGGLARAARCPDHPAGDSVDYSIDSFLRVPVNASGTVEDALQGFYVHEHTHTCSVCLVDVDTVTTSEVVTAPAELRVYAATAARHIITLSPSLTIGGSLYALEYMAERRGVVVTVERGAAGFKEGYKAQGGHWVAVMVTPSGAMLLDDAKKVNHAYDGVAGDKSRGTAFFRYRLVAPAGRDAGAEEDMEVI
jgi:hypothetical protein